MRWSKRIFSGLVVLAIVQTIYYYPRVPDTVASHFDGLGAADAWSSRNGFFGMYLLMILLVVGVFALLPRWSDRRKNFGMKIPHPEFWLAPERIMQTRLFFRRQMMLMGNVHLLLAIYVMQLAILANFAAEPRLHFSIYWALLAYFVVLAAWLLHFYLHFRNHAE